MTFSAGATPNIKVLKTEGVDLNSTYMVTSESSSASVEAIIENGNFSGNNSFATNQGTSDEDKMNYRMITFSPDTPIFPKAIVVRCNDDDPDAIISADEYAVKIVAFCI